MDLFAPPVAATSRFISGVGCSQTCLSDDQTLTHHGYHDLWSQFRSNSYLQRLIRHVPPRHNCLSSCPGVWPIEITAWLQDRLVQRRDQRSTLGSRSALLQATCTISVMAVTRFKITSSLIIHKAKVEITWCPRGSGSVCIEIRKVSKANLIPAYEYDRQSRQ